MRLLILAVAIAYAPASSAEPPVPAAKLTLPLAATPSSDCPRTTSDHAVKPGESLRPRRLGELPPANAYAAVYRQVGGCEVPVVVQYNVSGR